MTFPIRKARVSLQLSSHLNHSHSQGMNNQRPAQAVPVMDGDDWKARLPPDARHRIVNKIMDKLKRHLPVSGPEGLHELRKIAERVEGKVYSAAISEPEYLRKISLKMLTMKTKSCNAVTNSLPSNSAGHSKKSSNGKKSLASKKSRRSRMDTLKRHLPVSGQEGLHELRKMAVRLEENIYTDATSQSDYLRKITLKMLKTEMESQTAMASNLPSNSAGNSKTPPDPASLDSTAQTGTTNVGDWQEEVYQEIKIMKEMYLSDLNEMYQKIAAKLQQHDSLPQQPKTEQLEKLRIFKAMLERMITVLQVSKNNITPNFREKLGGYEKQIVNFINTRRPRKPVPPLQD